MEQECPPEQKRVKKQVKIYRNMVCFKKRDYQWFTALVAKLT